MLGLLVIVLAAGGLLTNHPSTWTEEEVGHVVQGVSTLVHRALQEVKGEVEAVVEETKRDVKALESYLLHQGTPQKVVNVGKTTNDRSLQSEDGNISYYRNDQGEIPDFHVEEEVHPVVVHTLSLGRTYTCELCCSAGFTFVGYVVPEEPFKVDSFICESDEDLARLDTAGDTEEWATLVYVHTSECSNPQVQSLYDFKSKVHPDLVKAHGESQHLADVIRYRRDHFARYGFLQKRP